MTERGAYRFAVERAMIDIDRFDELLARAGRAATDAARRSLTDALALAPAEVLARRAVRRWPRNCEDYRGRVIGANLEAADAALIARDFRASLTHAQAATRMDRFSERAHRTEMLALYAMGRDHEALEAYRRLRCLLVGELDWSQAPKPRAQAAILRQDEVSSLLPRPTREMQLRSSGHPWLLFLGRRAELPALAETLDSALAGELALVLVEGEAGIGKSRLLDEFTSTLDGVRVGRARCSRSRAAPRARASAAVLREVLEGLDSRPRTSRP